MRTLATLVLALLPSTVAAQDWRQAGPPVHVGGEHSTICYDPVRDRTLLFGGQRGNGTKLDETWEYDASAATWSRVQTPIAPPPRSACGMVYDTRRNSVLLFGGRGGHGLLNDTWEFRGNTWQRITGTLAPDGLGAMTYDSNRGQIVLQSFAGATWTFDSDTGAWSRPHVSTPNGGVEGLTMTYDAGRDRVLLFGGADCIWGSRDVWEFDPARGAWQRPLSHGGGLPPCFVAMVYDPTRGASIVFGGAYDSPYFLGETWAYDGTSARWSLAAPRPGWHSPLQSYGHSITFDTRRGVVRLVTPTIFGGSLITWELQPAPEPTWSSYGMGCAGSAGIPDLRPAPGSLPKLGSTFELHVDRLPNGSGHALLFTGFDIGAGVGTALPHHFDALQMPGCRLWLEPLWTESLSRRRPTLSLSLPIPDDARLAGLRVAMQVLSVDPAAPNRIGAVSNAGIATLH